MKKIILSSMIVLAIFGLGVYLAITFAITYAFKHIPAINAVIPTYSIKTSKNITYCSPAGEPQMLDLYAPVKVGATFPLVIYIHGGSWVSGTKDEEAIAQYLPTLAQTGYVVASLNYRLAPAHTFPAQVEDVKCAVRFLRANAQTYQIKPRKVGVIGESAGGYLAIFTGVTGDQPQFQTTEYPGVSDRVQAVVDLSGPTDFIHPSNASIASMQIARTFLGSASPVTASPITYVQAGDPPFLILHGSNDTIVPPVQSKELQSKLQGAGVASRLIIVKNAGHSFDALSTDPSISQLALTMLSFLHEQLQGNE